MPKNKISEYSVTNSDNADIGGINIAEGCPPSSINDAMREQMSQLKEFIDGSSGDTITTSKIVATTATILSGANVTGTATFNSAVVLSSSVTGTTASFSGATTIGGAAVLSSTLNVANTATMGVITGSTISGSANTLTVDGTDAVGFRNTPVNSQSAAYTLVLADSGKTILHPIADDNARTFTIPANSSVAYPVGTVVTFVNLINDVTIAITDDTMYLAGDGDTSSRTLAAYGVASAVKVASTSWVISGNGLS
jgi:hypothetical protein